MRWALLLTVAALVSPALAQDVDPSGAVTVEVTTERERWYVGERVTVGVSVVIRDRAFFDEHVVQPFQRELDLPVRIVAPWMDGRTVTSSVPYADPTRVAVNDSARGFGKTEDGSRQDFVFRAEEPAEISLSTELEMTVATEFREDFVEGRVAVDPRRVRIACPGPTIQVLPIPEEGRPADFSGGVGSRYEIGTSLEDADPERPGVIRLTILLHGRQERSDVAMPMLTNLGGLHVIGSRERHTTGGGGGGWAKLHVYELERTNPEVTEIPPIPFSFFDSVAAEYRTIHTEPIPLPESVIAEVVPDSPTVPEDVAESDEGATALFVGTGVLALLLLIVGIVLGRRRTAVHDHSAAERERAASEARAALALPGADAGDVLAVFLARLLGCAPAAVVSPDLSQRLQTAGFDASRAQSTANLLERLVAARYGGGPATDADRAAVRAVLDER